MDKKRLALLKHNEDEVELSSYLTRIMKVRRVCRKTGLEEPRGVGTGVSHDPPSLG